jgi:hypothetical protein
MLILIFVSKEIEVRGQAFWGFETAFQRDSLREIDVDRSDELYGFAQRWRFEAKGSHFRAK